MTTINPNAAGSAKVVSIIGWITFLALIVYGYFGHPSFLLAKAVGLTWLVYYFYRFTQPSESVADSNMGILILGVLLVLCGWGELISSVQRDELLRDIEKVCDQRASLSGQPSSECNDIQGLIDSYREPEISDVE